jgi:hypothetical protein
MKAGDRVTWVYTPRGGYAFAQRVAAIVVSLKAKSASIKVARKYRGEWVLEEKTVPLTKLSTRTTTVAELGESLKAGEQHQ